MNTTGQNSESHALAPGCAYPWTPDQGDGTYCNPVLHADYSDPDVVRHGDDYWLTASSFNCTPGLPILHSRDLVNWTLVNHALRQIPGERYEEVQTGCGVWAPTIRFQAGRFWIFFASPDEGIYLTTTADPRGRWSPPHLVQAGKGLIDPCPLWDDDGQAYLIHAYAHSRSGLKHQLRVVPMAPDGRRLLGEGKIVFHEPTTHHTIEGPKFLTREGWYYILAPAGGVAHGWQTALRSRNIYGPYEDRIVLAQGRTPVNGPHQGALVDTTAGEWWFLHFQDAGLYGRIVHLQPVQWQEGWPLMGTPGSGGIGEPVLNHRKPNLPSAPIAIPATSDEFSTSKLGLQWQWQANHNESWASLATRDGWLRLMAQPGHSDLSRTPNLLLQKFPTRAFAIATLVDFSTLQDGDEAGLVVMGNEYAALALRRVGSETCLILRTNIRTENLGAIAGKSGRLQLEVAEGGRCAFRFRGADDSLVTIPETFQATAGKWIGAKVGIYCTNAARENSTGYADFDYFRFSPKLPT